MLPRAIVAIVCRQQTGRCVLAPVEVIILLGIHHFCHLMYCTGGVALVCFNYSQLISVLVLFVNFCYFHRSVGSAESLLVMGEEFNRMVENIMEMGYERSQVSAG